jgi:pantetheine-phosphate adenylyltransferase
MAALNKHIDHEIETVFLMADIQNSFLSSSIVKELARNGGNIKGLVPDKIINDIMKKMY